jgi:predicted transcriptional regulator
MLSVRNSDCEQGFCPPSGSFSAFMSADDSTDPTEGDSTDDIEPADVRAELDRQRNGAGDDREFDEGIVDLLSCALDTDTRARIYVQLRRRPHSTAEEIAEGTGLYPSTVQKTLSDLHDEGVVERRERMGEEADDTDEYTAVGPNELADVVFGRVQDEFERLFGLDRRRGDRKRERDRKTEPVTIPVEKEDDEDDQ